MTYLKAEGLLSSDELTATSGFEGSAGLRLSDKPRDFTESLQDAENRAINKSKRLIIPKQLTSSEDERKKKEPDALNPVKLKFCKKMSQKENSQRIVQTYKNQVLMNSRLQLVMEDESNSNDTLNNENLECSVALTDFLKDYSQCSQTIDKIKETNPTSTIENEKEKESESENDNLMSSSQPIMSNCQESLSSIPHDKQTTQKAQKARKTFPLPLLNVSASSINNTEQISTPVSLSANSPTLKSNNVSGASSTSSVERQSLRRRYRRLRKVTTSDDDLLQCDTPKSSVKKRFERLRTPKRRLPLHDRTNQHSRSRSPHSITDENTEIQGNEESSHPILPNNFPLVDAQGNQRNSNLPNQNVQQNERQELNKSGDETSSDSSEGEGNEEDGEDEEVDCKYLYTYKRRLYKKYKKKNIDMKQHIDEHYKRYESTDDDNIHLGENITVGVKSWRLTKSQKYTTFLRDLGGYIWKKSVLPLRCLDLKKAKNNMPAGYEPKLCSPRKLNLYLNLYDDYLKEHKRYKHLSEDDHDKMIKNSTEVLTCLIRDERRIFKRKLSRTRRSNST